jgi:hypothetical protein
VLTNGRSRITALRACGLCLVVVANGEGDAHVPSTVVTVILIHWHGGSSSRRQGPLTGPPKDGGSKSTAGAIPRLDASHHREGPANGDGEDCLGYAKSLAPRCRSLLTLSSTLRKITAGREHRRGLKVALCSPSERPI